MKNLLKVIGDALRAAYWAIRTAIMIYREFE